ncbi:UPF0488 protein C8orf33 homolog isoform 2-T2 [Clarias gariepinus]
MHQGSLHDPTPVSSQGVMNPNEAPTGQATDLEVGSGFAFNFQIPVKTERESDPGPDTGKSAKSEVARDLGESADLKPKAKNKKKKKPAAGGGEKAVQEKGSNLREEAPKQEKTELTPEEQLRRELDWCIEQLELGLRMQKSSTKQKEEACRALKTLRSSKAPMVKKRQVMRAVSGDYRKKMEQERERQFKLIHSAMSSAKVTQVSEPRCKAVYHRRSEPHTPPAHSTASTEVSLPTQQSGGDGDGVGDRFVFKPSGGEFRFNFSI